MPPAPSETRLEDVPPTRSMYVGADPTTGYIRFSGHGPDGSGVYDVRRALGTPGRASIGIAATIALGLTECCAHIKKGKIFYFCKVLYAKNSRRRPLKLPDSYTMLPDLVYIDYDWSEEECQVWLQSSHTHRLEALSAEAGNLGPMIPTLPINLSFEIDNYADIQFFNGWGKTIMYYNTQGAMYLGFLVAMRQLARYRLKSSPQSSFWMAKKADIPHLQVRSGVQAVEMLRDMLEEGRPQTIFLYQTIHKKFQEVHREWVDAGGYTIEGDPVLGPKTASRVARVRDKMMELGIIAPSQPAAADEARRVDGDRLRALRDQVASWPNNVRQALESYSAAANTDAATLARFMNGDEAWNGLTTEDKDKIIDFWELEQAANDRV